MSSKQLSDNIVILQRKLVNLKDSIDRSTISIGQEKFINGYLELTGEFINKSFDLLDITRYKEEVNKIFEEE